MSCFPDVYREVVHRVDEAIFSAVVILGIVTTMITPPALQWSLTRGERIPERRMTLLVSRPHGP